MELAHTFSCPCEAELGKVMGHEKNRMMPYEEMFASKTGFTDVNEAMTFVERTDCDWLSIAAGNIHGAVSGVLKDKEKPTARLDITHIKNLSEALNRPLVLHGGSGIEREYIIKAIKNGIAKINVGTEIRKAYESGLFVGGTTNTACQSVYNKVRWLLKEFYGISGCRNKLGL